MTVFNFSKMIERIICSCVVKIQNDITQLIYLLGNLLEMSQQTIIPSTD